MNLPEFELISWVSIGFRFAFGAAFGLFAASLVPAIIAVFVFGVAVVS